MIRSLKEPYKSELMYPSFLSIFINPFYLIRKGLLDGIKENAHYMTGVMMDFGCGDSPIGNSSMWKKYVGLDIAESGHDHSSEEVEVLVREKNTNYVETIVQIWITYLCRSLLPKARYLGPLVTMGIVCPFSILGLILSRLMPKNEAFYHNSIIVARKNRSLIGSRNHAAL